MSSRRWALTNGAACLLLGLTVISCGAEEDGQLASEQSPLFFEPSSNPATTLWNNASVSNPGPLGTNATISVCFAAAASNRCPKQTASSDCEGKTTSPFATGTINQNILRPLIRKTIESTWAKSANLEFLNWGDCATTKNAAGQTVLNDAALRGSIVIQFQQEFDPPANKSCTSDSDCSATPHAICAKATPPATSFCTALGVDFTTVLGKTTSAPTVIQYNWPPIQGGTDIGNVIHEFGHALGFAHEWRRSDFSDSRCTKTNTPDLNDVDVKKALVLSPFPDSASIMNYCGKISNTTLSPGDVLGLQRAYGRKASGSLVSSGGMCADINGASSALGTPIIGFPCRNQNNDTFSRDSSSQRLRATLIDSNGQGTPRCLNVSGGAVSSSAPTPAISWVCDDGTNEMFVFIDVEWRGMGNMCATADGSAITMKPCDGTRAQKWTFFDGDPHSFLAFNQIRSTSTGFCVATATTNGAMGENLTLAACSAADPRQLFSYPGNGIISFSSSLCLNVLGGTAVPGRPVGLWNGCTEARPFNEQFSLSGNVKSLGQCLDSSNNNQISVATCSSSSPNQTWEFYL